VEKTANSSSVEATPVVGMGESGGWRRMDGDLFAITCCNLL